MVACASSSSRVKRIKVLAKELNERSFPGELIHRRKEIRKTRDWHFAKLRKTSKRQILRRNFFRI